jgi:hypothetical protein
LNESTDSDTNQRVKKKARNRRKKVEVFICKFVLDGLKDFFDHENKRHKKQEIIKKFIKWNPEVRIDDVFLYFKRRIHLKKCIYLIIVILQKLQCAN